MCKWRIVQFSLHYNSVISNQYREKCIEKPLWACVGEGLTKRRLSIKKFGVVHNDLQGFRLAEGLLYQLKREDRVCFASGKAVLKLRQKL